MPDPKLVTDTAYNQGRRAASYAKYEDNPYCPTTMPEAHLAWSKGHNDQRAQNASD